MHSLYYVVIPKKGIKNSKEAKQRASQTLMDNNFSGSEGYFGGGKADWFVVGGRWSGELTKLLLDRKKLTAVKRKLGEDHWWTGGKEKITREDRR